MEPNAQIKILESSIIPILLYGAPKAHLKKIQTPQFHVEKYPEVGPKDGEKSEG